MMIMCQAMGRFGIWGKQTHDESVIPRDIARDTFIKSWSGPAGPKNHVKFDKSYFYSFCLVRE